MYMALEDKDRTARPEAYPKPSETDQQWKQQDEYSTLQPNKVADSQDASAVPTTDRNDLRAAEEDQVIEGTP
jgi:hypothetical protein